MRAKGLVMVLKGPITVSYQKKGGRWYCTACEFDVVGVGRTRGDAFCLLCELLDEYFSEIVSILHKGKKVAFFNPSEADVWNSEDIQYYDVQVKVSKTKKSPSSHRYDMKELIKFIDTIETFELVPIGG
jgi:hypothetical protein